MTAWTILSAGPSLEELDPRTFQPTGPVIALGSAAFAPLPVDFWVVHDRIKGLRRLDEVDRQDSVVVWCSHPQVEAWNAMGYRTWSQGFYEDFRHNFVPSDMDESCHHGLSITIAIARAIKYGAKSFDIYGCDMEGRNHAYGGIADISNRTEKEITDRWRTEREVFAYITDAWNDRYGIEFRVHRLESSHGLHR